MIDTNLEYKNTSRIYDRHKEMRNFILNKSNEVRPKNTTTPTQIVLVLKRCAFFVPIFKIDILLHWPRKSTISDVYWLLLLLVIIEFTKPINI